LPQERLPVRKIKEVLRLHSLGLSQRQISEPQIVQHLYLPADRRLGGEEAHAFLDRHVQNVVNGLAAQRDFESFAVEPRP